MTARTMPKPAQRIVSLAPNVTSILLAIGAGSELVGVSKWCKDVVRIGRRPHVGDCWKLDVREVMCLHPTLLIGSVPFAPMTVEEILKQPVSFLALSPRSLADIYTDIRTLGRVAGRAPAAESLISKIRRAFSQIAKRAERLSPRPHVYCEAWPNPRISSPPWVAELVEMAGGRMVLPPGARVTDQQVARAKPSSALRNPIWQSLPAVRNRRVFVIRDELLNTPGPPLMQGLQELSRIFHAAVRNLKASP